MISNHELNMKLADFAEVEHDWDDEICGYKTTESFCRNCWSATDYTPFPCVPDFTHSLDACFKWLVPKLQDKGYMVELYSYEQKGYKVSIYLIIGQVDIPIVIRTDETPALALCLAIEKLIDKEVNHEDLPVAWQAVHPAGQSTLRERDQAQRID